MGGFRLAKGDEALIASVASARYFWVMIGFTQHGVSWPPFKTGEGDREFVPAFPSFEAVDHAIQVMGPDGEDLSIVRLSRKDFIQWLHFQLAAGVEFVGMDSKEHVGLFLILDLIARMT